MAGCQDQTVRFINIFQGEKLHEYSLHNYQIKSVDHNQKDLYLSTDNRAIVVFDLAKKAVVRMLYPDMFLP